MRRRLTSQEERELAARRLAEAVCKPKRKKRDRTFGPAARTRARVDIERRAEANDWGDAKATDMVWLYAFCHCRVYGIEPVDIDGKQVNVAIMNAGRLLRQFEAAEPMVEFIRWAWKRAETRYKRGQVGRLSWHNLFVGKFVLNDYLVEMKRI